MAIVCFLGLIANAEPLDERMDTHWRLASALETEVIHGNLEVVRQTATRLSALPTDGFGVELEEPLEHLKSEATTLATATTLNEATVGVARVAAACGACHMQSSAGPPVRLKAWTPVGTEENAEMAAHEESMDWMWLGLIGPSEDAWRRGSRGLRKTAPNEQVHDVAERAEQTDRPGRPAVYAELLQACAGCHVNPPTPSP